jgi:hypothetical protein
VKNLRSTLVTAALVIGAFSGATATGALADDMTTPTPPAVQVAETPTFQPAPVITRGTRELADPPRVVVPTGSAFPSDAVTTQPVAAPEPATPTAQPTSAPAPVVTRNPRPVRTPPVIVTPPALAGCN